MSRLRLWLEAFKPAAGARWHLLLAATMWTVVGAILLAVGVRWTLTDHMAWAGAWLALAVLAGGLKAWFVLDRTARRIVERIRARGDGRCLGGFVSIKTWLFIILMSTLGRILRGGLLPRGVVGLVYAMVGTALLAATWRIWRAWGTYAAEG